MTVWQAYAPQHEVDDRYIPSTFVDPNSHGSQVPSRLSSGCADISTCSEVSYGVQIQNTVRFNSQILSHGFGNCGEYSTGVPSSRTVFGSSANALDDQYLPTVNNNSSNRWHAAQNSASIPQMATDQWSINQLPKFQQGQNTVYNHSEQRDSESCFPSLCQARNVGFLPG
jgi:hypothetical protein